jgi:hypothetical protein
MLFVVSSPEGQFRLTAKLWRNAFERPRKGPGRTSRNLDYSYLELDCDSRTSYKREVCVIYIEGVAGAIVYPSQRIPSAFGERRLQENIHVRSMQGSAMVWRKANNDFGYKSNVFQLRRELKGSKA